MAADRFGVRPSTLVEVCDDSPAAALAFDLACIHRVIAFENERDFGRLKLQRIMTRIAVHEAISMAMVPDYKPPSDDLDEDAEPDEGDLL